MSRSTNTRRWLLIGSAALGLAALGVSQATAGRPARIADRDTPTETVVNPVAADMPSVSADGRLVAYAGQPPRHDGRQRTIYLLDRTDGSVVELAPLPAGARPGESAWPVVSGDGCTVTFLTELPFDMFRDDDGPGRWDVYRQQLPACGGVLGQLDLVSTLGGGFDASAADDAVPTDRPAVSADGSLVAYTYADPLVDGLTGVMLVDLAVPLGGNGRSRPVAGTPFGQPDGLFVHHGQSQPSMSADGTVVAFTSDADSAALDPTWGAGAVEGGPATTRVFLWDRTNPDLTTAVREVSVAAGSTALPNGDANSPAVSADGQFVAFVSTASGLVPGAVLPACNPDCVPQVYLWGRADGSLRLASRAPGPPESTPVGADAGATQPALGYSDGEVLFVSRATNLFATRSTGGGGADDGDIVRVVPATGEVQRVSVMADGVTPAPAANAHPRMSAAGRLIVFDTLAGGIFADPNIAGRQLAMIPVTPRMEMASLDIGTVDVDMPSAEWFLTLVNHGPGSFQPATVTIDLPDFLLNGGSCVDGHFVLAPGATCTVNVMFVPTIDGPQTATLAIAEAGYGALSLTAQISGIGGSAALFSEPGGGYTGEQPVGTSSAPVGFMVRNTSSSPTTVRSVTLAGNHPQDYVVVVDGCSGQTVAPGEACPVQVVFKPTGSGRRTATVVTTASNGAYATYLVSGDSRYVPMMTTSTATIVAGQRVLVAGSGFSPYTTVVLRFADGNGRPIRVNSDAYGAISTVVLVRAGERTGERLLVGQTADGQTAGVWVTVLPPAGRLGPGSAAWPGR
ncbi:MAG TPA: choice-of-anchor D domain-containing protein [Ilumatobacteraceae bacterium]|nr:choice-of-anchor D domain-containing protein [Ilumatobacteraceae bacterium]